MESVLSLRPILGHTKDQKEAVLTPRRLTHPYISGELLNQNAIDIFKSVFEPDQTISQLGRAGHESKQWLRDALLSYLQESGVRYQNEKAGDNQKKSYSTLKPLLHDIVLYLDSDKKKRFGIILELCEKNQVIIRSVLYGSTTTRKFHIRVLTLLYRPQEWEGDFPVE